MKRLLAFTMSLVICLSIIPMDIAFAQDGNTESGAGWEAPDLKYLLVEKEYMEIGEQQNIVVSLGGAENLSLRAILEYKNEASGEIWQTESVAGAGDSLLFQPVMQNQGIYTLLSIQYTYAGQTERIALADVGIHAQFGVGVSADAEPDDYLIDPSALDIESSIVSVEEGEVIGEDSIADALGVSPYRLKGRAQGGKLVVVLDPGHDDDHVGAHNNGYEEEDLTVKIAQYCKAELEQYRDVIVYMTRSGEACPNGGKSVNYIACNKKRVEFAAANGADVYVSLHLNSNEKTEPNGAGVYYPNQSYRPDLSADGKGLATEIINKLKALGLNEWAGGVLIRNSDDGTVYPDGSIADYLTVIQRSKEAGVPAVLVEHAFLSNSNDVNYYLSSNERLRTLGVSDAEAIAKYYGLQKGIDFKWVNLGSGIVNVGSTADLYYGVNQNARVTVQMFYGNNTYLKTLVADRYIGTNDQVARWDLTDSVGEYVPNGTYRFTITAVTDSGQMTTAHRWFKVTGSEPLAYRWTNLGSGVVNVGNTADLYYAVNKRATVTVNMYYGNNNFLKTLVSNRAVGSNDQVARWDLTDGAGEYVQNGTYRFTITAVTASGETMTAHKWFRVTGNDPLTYKWANLGSGSAKIGSTADLYYAVNKNATVTVQMFYGNNNFLKTLVSNRAVGTNDQVARWDLTDNEGEYVPNGTYRFTMTAITPKGEVTTVHKWFQVTGNVPLNYRWANLSAPSVNGTSDIQLYYAVNKKAKVTVQVFYGNNNYLKTLVADRQVATNDQVASWDLTDSNGNYVPSGQYRFTIYAVAKNGESVIAHKYFTINNFDIMGASSTTVDKMVAYYNANGTYPAFYANTEAPTIRDFCQIYYDECAAEGVKAEVAFAQAMKETGYLRFQGLVKPEQYNFAGLDSTGRQLDDGTLEAGRWYDTVTLGIRAHVQRLRAYAVKGTTVSSYSKPCVDSYKFEPWWVSNIVGNAPYVEWLGQNANPSGYGWATSPGYGYSIRDDYLRKLLRY